MWNHAQVYELSMCAGAFDCFCSLLKQSPDWHKLILSAIFRLYRAFSFYSIVYGYKRNNIFPLKEG